MEQARGTLVHTILEHLFDLPAAHRTLPHATKLVSGHIHQLVDEHPDLSPILVDNPDHHAALLTDVNQLLAGYFTMEDPRLLEPAEREFLIEAPLDSGILLRGYIDRLDISPTGDMRVVDYKTGNAPREAFEAQALFQLKFYALALLVTRGTAPRVLRLIYLKNVEICDFIPDVGELRQFERTLVALNHAIERAIDCRDFRPRTSRLCDWCAYHRFCPAQGGTLPPYPERKTIS